MVKPLRSEQVTRPKDVQFAHFGVLETGPQSKASLFTSLTLNGLLLTIAILVGMMATKTAIDNKKTLTTLVMPVEEKKPEPPKPVVKPPKPLPEVPKIKPVEPKILLPKVQLPEPPKPVPVKMAEVKLPPVMPAPPKATVAMAAPKIQAVNLPSKNASVVNNDRNPAPVALGRPDSPVHSSLTGPAISPVNLQRGLAGMPSSNRGGGPPATAVSLGNGQPNGSLNGNGKRTVEGVKLGVNNGVPGATGNGIGTRPAQVELGRTIAPTMPTQVARPSAASAPPTVISKPKPTYSAEATAMHLEGVVSVRIRVEANGAVQVLGISSGLGHGLDEAARQAAAGMRFKPAHDAAGNPVPWEGVVNFTFQLAT